jgi:hypothetical protein
MLKRIPNRSQLGAAKPATSSTPTVAANREPRITTGLHPLHRAVLVLHLVTTVEQRSDPGKHLLRAFLPPLMLYLGVIRNALDLNVAGLELRVWSVGTPVAEGELYRRLKLQPPTKEALDVGASYPPAPATARTTPGVLQADHRRAPGRWRRIEEAVGENDRAGLTGDLPGGNWSGRADGRRSPRPGARHRTDGPAQSWPTREGNRLAGLTRPRPAK